MSLCGGRPVQVRCALGCAFVARTTGWYPSLALYSGRLDTRSAPSTASAGQRRDDVEVKNYLWDQAGSLSLVFDLSITHERFGSSSHVQQNGLLTHLQDLDAPLRLAAHRKINSYRQQFADNQNISFLPVMMTTSSRMHGEFLRLLLLLVHRETEAHFIATGMPSQSNNSDMFRLKRAACFQSLKTSKVGLAAAGGVADQPQHRRL